MTAYKPLHAPAVTREPSRFTQFFRRVIAAMRREKAAPGVRPGAATGYPCCAHCDAPTQCYPPDSHPGPCTDCDDLAPAWGKFSDACAWHEITTGTPVLDDRMLHEVREQWNAWHDGTPPRHDLLSTAELAALHPRGQHPYPERPTRLQRPDGEIVIDERNHVGVYPWPRAEQPHFPPPPEPERADATSVDLNRARPYVRQSTWGEKPQLVVEPELARVLP